MKHLKLYLILAIACFFGVSVQAATNRFSLIQDIPASSGVIYTERSAIESKMFLASFSSSYLYKPFSFTDHLQANYLGFTFAPSSNWQMEAVLPFVLYNKHSSPDALNAPFVNKWGLSDVFVRGRIRLWQNRDMGLALIPFFTIPIGNENHYIADKYPRGGVKAAFDWQWASQWYSAVNLGVEARQSVSLLNYSQKGRVLMSVGMNYTPSEFWKIKSDLVFSTAINKPFQEVLTSPLEWMAALELGQSPIHLNVGGGLALVRGATTPKFRMFAGITMALGSKMKSHSAFRKLNQEELRLIETAVYFTKNSIRLGLAQKKKLDLVVEILKKHPNARIEAIQKYVYKSKSKIKKSPLMRRASAVKSYFELNGIKSDRVHLKSDQEVVPRSIVLSNLNRKVELRVVTKSYD